VFTVLKIITAKYFSALVLNDVEYVKVHLSTNLTPSTSAHYLEQRLEIIQYLGTLHASMADVFANSHGNTPMSLG
jgi:hypothetical protein